MHAYSTSRARGFSLVEMLTVVAVIAILAALLLPALSSFRMRARGMECTQNLRTLAMAYQQYLVEWDGQPLQRGIKSTDPEAVLENGHNFQGIAVLRRYYRSGPPPYVFHGGTYIENPVESCPSAEFNNATDNPSLGKGYNFLARDNIAVLCGGTAPRLNAYFASPPETPLFWPSWDINWGRSPYMPVRHQGKINMAFFDGHVESIPEDDERLYKGYIENVYRTGRPDSTALGTGTKLAVESSP